VSISTDIPQVNMPSDQLLRFRPEKPMQQSPTSRLAQVPNGGVSVGIIGDLFAGFANGRGQNSFGVLPILYGTSLSKESVVGGTSVNATVTLQSAAPAGGITVRLVSSDPNIVRPPATVFHSGGSHGHRLCKFLRAQSRFRCASSSKPARTSTAIALRKPG
jgi:hypothetical protein